MQQINPDIEQSWKETMMKEFNSEYFVNLKSFLLEEREKNTIYPPGSLIFNAFNMTPFNKVKVVILGQDPYHGIGQAHGLCFSVPHNIAKPPSLKNIYKEIESDTGAAMPAGGNLENWAKQGVLLLNATLTVRANSPGSHQNKGWEDFTDAAIKSLSEKRTGIIFLLWGNFAQAKSELINQEKHYILKAPHPSPFSANRGFFGCKHFSKTNELLIKMNKSPIEWNNV